MGTQHKTTIIFSLPFLLFFFYRQTYAHTHHLNSIERRLLAFHRAQKTLTARSAVPSVCPNTCSGLPCVFFPEIHIHNTTYIILMFCFFFLRCVSACFIVLLIALFTLLKRRICLYFYTRLLLIYIFTRIVVARFAFISLISPFCLFFLLFY